MGNNTIYDAFKIYFGRGGTYSGTNQISVKTLLTKPYC